MNEVENLTKEWIKKGGILAYLYYDLQGAKKEIVEQAGIAIVQNLLGMKEDVVYAVGEIDEIKENNSWFSSYIQIKVLTKSFASLVKICENSSPFSIEILEPAEIKISLSEAHRILTNISRNNYELKKVMLEKVLEGKDLENFLKAVSERLKMSKKVLEKKGENK